MLSPRIPVPVIPLKANRADLVRTILHECAAILTASDEVFRDRLQRIQDAISDFRKAK